MKKLLMALAVAGAAMLVACNGNKKANEEATNTEVAGVQSNYEMDAFTTKSGKKVKRLHVKLKKRRIVVRVIAKMMRRNQDFSLVYGVNSSVRKMVMVC